MKIFQPFLFALTLISLTTAQNKISDDYLILNARADDPLFATYAAAMDRSRFFADKAYFMNYFTPGQPITYSSQFAGDWAVIWKVNNLVVNSVGDFINPPLVVASFPDMTILEYEPFQGLEVQETFFVFSSGAAIIDMQVRNSGKIKYDFNLYPVLFTGRDSLSIAQYDTENRGYVFTHQEPLQRLHSNLYKDRDYPAEFRNFLAMNLTPN
jgi:hypothetical protein